MRGRLEAFLPELVQELPGFVPTPPCCASWADQTACVWARRSERGGWFVVLSFNDTIPAATAASPACGTRGVALPRTSAAPCAAVVAVTACCRSPSTAKHGVASCCNPATHPCDAWLLAPPSYTCKRFKHIVACARAHRGPCHVTSVTHHALQRTQHRKARLVSLDTHGHDC